MVRLTGLVSDVFGIYDVGGRREHWTVTHNPTGLKLTVGNGFLAVESAKEFVEKISPKADWKTLGPGNPPPDLGMEIWNEMIVEDCCLIGAIPIIDQSPWQSDENPFKHVGRNDLCPRGPGKKCKKCCLQ